MASDQPAALVTGAAGFLGSHLSELLLKRGHRVVGVDCFTPYYDRGLKEKNLHALRGRDGFDFVEADLSRDPCEPLVQGARWVFHQAAQPGVRASWDRGFAEYTRHNLVATHRLLEAGRRGGVERFVYASSSSVYGNVPEGEVDESADLVPLSPYGVTKLAGEKLAQVYHREFGMATVGLRYFTVCGPRQRPDMAFHRLLRAMHRDEPFPLYGDGEQERDFTDVSDAVEANLLAAERGLAGEVYNIGGGRPVSVNYTVEVLERVTGKRARLDRRVRADGDPRRTAANLSRARRDLGYAPRVPVEDALRREAEWFAGPDGPGDQQWGGAA